MDLTETSSSWSSSYTICRTLIAAIQEQIEAFEILLQKNDDVSPRILVEKLQKIIGELDDWPENCADDISKSETIISCDPPDPTWPKEEEQYSESQTENSSITFQQPAFLLGGFPAPHLEKVIPVPFESQKICSKKLVIPISGQVDSFQNSSKRIRRLPARLDDGEYQLSSKIFKKPKQIDKLNRKSAIPPVFSHRNKVLYGRRKCSMVKKPRRVRKPNNDLLALEMPWITQDQRTRTGGRIPKKDKNILKLVVREEAQNFSLKQALQVSVKVNRLSINSDIGAIPAHSMMMMPNCVKNETRVFGQLPRATKQEVASRIQEISTSSGDDGFETKLFQCLSCHKVYQHRRSTWLHIRQSHFREWKWCPICGQSFVNTWNLRLHHESAHMDQ